MAIKTVVVRRPLDLRLVFGRDRRPKGRLKLFYGDLVVSIDAHFARNLHGLLGDLTGGKLGMLGQSLGCGLRVRAAAADGGDSRVGLDDVALSAQQKRLLFV